MMIRAVALCLCLASPLFAAERGVPAANIHADVFFTPEEEHPKIA